MICSCASGIAVAFKRPFGDSLPDGVVGTATPGELESEGSSESDKLPATQFTTPKQFASLAIVIRRPSAVANRFASRPQSGIHSLNRSARFQTPV